MISSKHVLTAPTFDVDALLAAARMRDEIDLDRHLAVALRVAHLHVLRRLRVNKRLYELIGRLRIERQCVAQRLQLGALLQKGFLQALSARVHKLLDVLQAALDNGALARRQRALLHVLGDLIHDAGSDIEILIRRRLLQ